METDLISILTKRYSRYKNGINIYLQKQPHRRGRNINKGLEKLIRSGATCNSFKSFKFVEYNPVAGRIKIIQ